MSPPFEVLDTTAPPASRTADARGPVPMLAFVVVWCEKEPWRVGEVAFFPPSTTKWVGRGDPALIKDYASWDQQRPGDTAPGPLGLVGCLHGDSLSRRQAKVTASAVDLEVQNLGTCGMCFNGKEVQRALVRPGDTIMFIGEVVLLCVLRQPTFPALLYTTNGHAFGEPDLCGFVGEGPVAWLIREMATRLGQGTDFVLILGESGTGKTSVAQLMHRVSERAQARFLRRNCQNLTQSILEAQLFGKIANFPNPGPAVEGALPAAHAGTLFLDEIGRLSAEAQGHLLTVLDSGEYQSIGEAKPRRLDVRFIGATNLERSVLQPDFQYRFPVGIRLAPLRERREDIALLVRELLRRRLAKDPSLMRYFTKGPKGELFPRMSGRLMDFLVRHHLEGNTRELDALLVAAIGDRTQERIEMFNDDAIPSFRPAPTAPEAAPPAAEREADGAPVTHEEVVAALEKAKWNVSKAAKSLDVQRTKLYRIMTEMGIRGIGG